MITAKEARDLMQNATSYRKEAEAFIEKLSKTIKERAEAGLHFAISKMPTDNNSCSIVIKTLNANGYAWKIENANDILILYVWW